MEDEDRLIERCLAGDREAFGGVTALYRDRIVRYLTMMVGREAVAEDLAQEAFRRAWQNLAGFERRSKLSTWLYRIAVNLARNHLRDESHEAKPADAEVLDAHIAARRRSVLSSVVGGETVDLVMGAVDRLPPSLREAFVLQQIEGLDAEEIGRITETPVGTVYVRAHRARALLRERLGPVVDTFWVERGESS